MTATHTARGAGPRPRHVPQRTCIGCRAACAKRGFVRIVRTEGGRVTVDPTGKQAGRGAYLCKQASCWETALKRDAVSRALKVSLLAQDREALAMYGAALPESASTSRTGES